MHVDAIARHFVFGTPSLSVCFSRTFTRVHRDSFCILRILRILYLTAHKSLTRPCTKHQMVPHFLRMYMFFSNVRACAYQTAIDAENGQNMHIQLLDKDATEDEKLGR